MFLGQLGQTLDHLIKGAWMKTYRFILTGLGHIGCNFLKILLTHEELLRERYGVALQAVGLADSSGVAYAEDGLDISAVVALKQRGCGIAELVPYGQPGVKALTLVQQVQAEFLVEATLTDLHNGQPGLDIVRTGLKRGMHTVLANKGPLALAYQELAALSDLKDNSGPALRFSGAAGGALPTVNVGWRDLAGGRITRMEAVLNSTTQLILDLMVQGQSYEMALAEARRIGIAEPDPSLDVEGWDAASKLVILANSVLGCPTTLADVTVKGIDNVTVTELRAAQAAGGRVSLLAVAKRLPKTTARSDHMPYQLSVAPTILPAGHPLAHLRLNEKGIVYDSDIYGLMTVILTERGPVGAAAALLRNIIEIVAPLK